MTPDEFTNQELMLDVGDGHELYVQDWGNHAAKTPILYLHGGPGAAVKNKYRQMFDPKRQRVIFYDQRGCGKSTPFGSLKHNETSYLVADIDKIVDRLKLTDFVIAGGSWGSCLALAYGVEHPSKIKAMVLRGIFTARKSELDWFSKGQYRSHFPEVWQRYLDATPPEFQSDPDSYHFPRILGKDLEAARTSAYIYGATENALMSLDDRFSPEDPATFDPTAATLEVSYLSQGCFLPENYIFDNTDKLTMPIWLIQGRYDMVCPPYTAYELNQRLPRSELIWTTAGHGSSDRPNYDMNRTILLQLTG